MCSLYRYTVRCISTCIEDRYMYQVFEIARLLSFSLSRDVYRNMYSLYSYMFKYMMYPALLWIDVTVSSITY